MEERLLTIIYGLKEVSLKRLNSIRLQLYDILEKAKLWRRKRSVITRD